MLAIYSILSCTEEIDQQLMMLNLWDGNHSQYVSFKETNTDIRLGALHTNNIVNIKAKFEILEDVLVN